MITPRHELTTFGRAVVTRPPPVDRPGLALVVQQILTSNIPNSISTGIS